jgi:hypothetical protein
LILSCFDRCSTSPRFRVSITGRRNARRPARWPARWPLVRHLRGHAGCPLPYAAASSLKSTPQSLFVPSSRIRCFSAAVLLVETCRHTVGRSVRPRSGPHPPHTCAACRRPECGPADVSVVAKSRRSGQHEATAVYRCDFRVPAAHVLHHPRTGRLIMHSSKSAETTLYSLD